MTLWRCQLMRSSTTGWAMPQCQWPMWKMPITQQGCWPRQHCGTFWVPRTSMRSSVIERAFQVPCRYISTYTKALNFYYYKTFIVHNLCSIWIWHCCVIQNLDKKKSSLFLGLVLGTPIYHYLYISAINHLKFSLLWIRSRILYIHLST